MNCHDNPTRAKRPTQSHQMCIAVADAHAATLGPAATIVLSLNAPALILNGFPATAVEVATVAALAASGGSMHLYDAFTDVMRKAPGFLPLAVLGCTIGARSTTVRREGYRLALPRDEDDLRVQFLQLTDGPYPDPLARRVGGRDVFAIAEQLFPDAVEAVRSLDHRVPALVVAREVHAALDIEMVYVVDNLRDWPLPLRQRVAGF